MRPGRMAMGILFYVGLAAVIAAILSGVLDDVLPQRLARRISINSEGFTLALLLALWIQFARPRLAGSRRQWPVTLAVALGCATVGLLLLASELPSRFRTLNEAFLAAGVVVTYLQLRRPLPRWLPIALSAGILAVTVLGARTELITGLAETLGVLILLPLAVDVFDRGILDPQARPSAAMRYGWYAFLVIVPITFSVLERTVDAGGAFGDVTRYGVRMHESFICILLVLVYFTVGLGRRGRGSGRPPGQWSPDERRPPPAPGRSRSDKIS